MVKKVKRKKHSSAFTPLCNVHKCRLHDAFTHITRSSALSLLLRHRCRVQTEDFHAILASATDSTPAPDPYSVYERPRRAVSESSSVPLPTFRGLAMRRAGSFARMVVRLRRHVGVLATLSVKRKTPSLSNTQSPACARVLSVQALAVRAHSRHLEFLKRMTT